MTSTLTALPYLPAATTTRTNLFTNPRPVGTASWAAFPGAGGSSALSAVAYGTPIIGKDGTVLPAAQRLVVSQSVASTGPGGLYWTGSPGSVTPGATYTASVYVAATPMAMRVSIVWFNASGTQIGQASGTPVMAGGAADGYERMWATGVAPAGASYATVTFYSQGAIPAPASLVYVGMLFEPAASLGDYFDGSTRAPVGSLDAWTGAVNASTSTRSTRSPAPAVSIQSVPTLVLDYSAPRESASVKHLVLGRPDPVHALGPLRAREGRLGLFYATLASAQRGVRVHEAARVMLRDSEDAGNDMYYVPRSVELAATPEKTATQRYQVSVEYTEVYATAGAY